MQLAVVVVVYVRCPGQEVGRIEVVILIDMLVTMIEKRLLVWRPVAAMDAR